MELILVDESNVCDFITGDVEGGEIIVVMIW